MTPASRLRVGQRKLKDKIAARMKLLPNDLSPLQHLSLMPIPCLTPDEISLLKSQFGDINLITKYFKDRRNEVLRSEQYFVRGKSPILGSPKALERKNTDSEVVLVIDKRVKTGNGTLYSSVCLTNNFFALGYNTQPAATPTASITFIKFDGVLSDERAELCCIPGRDYVNTDNVSVPGPAGHTSNEPYDDTELWSLVITVNRIFQRGSKFSLLFLVGDSREGRNYTSLPPGMLAVKYHHQVIDSNLVEVLLKVFRCDSRWIPTRQFGVNTVLPIRDMDHVTVKTALSATSATAFSTADSTFRERVSIPEALCECYSIIQRSDQAGRRANSRIFRFLASFGVFQGRRTDSGNFKFPVAPNERLRDLPDETYSSRCALRSQVSVLARRQVSAMKPESTAHLCGVWLRLEQRSAGRFLRVDGGAMAHELAAESEHRATQNLNSVEGSLIASSRVLGTARLANAAGGTQLIRPVAAYGFTARDAPSGLGYVKMPLRAGPELAEERAGRGLLACASCCCGAAGKSQRGRRCRMSGTRSVALLSARDQKLIYTVEREEYKFCEGRTRIRRVEQVRAGGQLSEGGSDFDAPISTSPLSCTAMPHATYPTARYYGGDAPGGVYVKSRRSKRTTRPSQTERLPHDISDLELKVGHAKNLPRRVQQYRKCESAAQEIIWHGFFYAHRRMHVERRIHLALERRGAVRIRGECKGYPCTTHHREYFNVKTIRTRTEFLRICRGELRAAGEKDLKLHPMEHWYRVSKSRVPRSRIRKTRK
ncbi:hypothetical protein C8R43DRAFT_950824 [Mycena crocata]|nr:hypothetical protein C8R43DRAFT_950824 [Mycena crocata]